MEWVGSVGPADGPRQSEGSVWGAAEEQDALPQPRSVEPVSGPGGFSQEPLHMEIA